MIRNYLISIILIIALILSVNIVTFSNSTKSILDLQTRRTEISVPLKGRQNESVTLINLNPVINAWYILQINKDDKSIESYHLENAYPGIQKLELSENGRELILAADSLPPYSKSWSVEIESVLAEARKIQRPFVELCEGRLYLRNPTVGKRTRKEWMTDLLRDRVKYGERITTFIKEKLFRDKYRQIGVRKKQAIENNAIDNLIKPVKVHTETDVANLTLTTPDLNLTISVESGQGMKPGHWYPVTDYPGVFVSAVTPELVFEDPTWIEEVLISPLDDKESSALVYLVAFDLSKFDLHFALGTDHPRVGWSDRVPETSHDPLLPGPDGFDTVLPLVRTGKVNPHNVRLVAATFAGGFKRTHGAFKWGELASKNHGSHYGFVENGVVFSTLNPGLATLIVYVDGTVDMKTWQNNDRLFTKEILGARQNGVPLLEKDNVTGEIRPGSFVKDWAKGNWSGSESKQLRTLRAGVGIQETDTTRFLIYGYFSSTTPSTMARVFRACGCKYAMQLDMNAPEHTYLAIYRIIDDKFVVQRLVKEMAEVDPPVDGQELPRFIGYSDNRDFFYFLRK